MAMDEALVTGAVPQPQPAAVDFNVGDVVLAFHGQLLYEATILEVGPGPSAESYKVHYQGWKKSWDETVPRSDVVVHNDENLRIAHELLRSAKSRQQRATLAAVSADGTGTAAGGATATAGTTSRAEGAPPPGTDAATRRKQDDAPMTQKPEASFGKPEATANLKAESSLVPTPGAAEDAAHVPQTTARRVRKADHTEPGDPAALFELPGSLKRQLVDDWEFVTKEQKLVTLPRDVTVAKILNEWLKTRSGGADRASRELVDSLLEYFDALLPTMLLYRFERPQFHELFSAPKNEGEKPTPSNVYGAEHLLRMFVKLPYLLNDAKLDAELMKEAAARINDIARYIQKNGRVMVMAEYEPASARYLALVTQQRS
jgi:mortality factor 4-like protein 1